MTEKSETIILVDGMYLLFSSFYANRDMRTLKGEPTGALYGFITRIEALVRDMHPQRIAVAFDSKGKTFRHRLYEPYKAKRLVPPEDLVAQIPRAREYLSLRGISLFEVPGIEADDIIAGCSRCEAQKGNQVIIFTADKDLFQLVGDHISIYHPRLKQKMDAPAIKEHFGVLPGQVVDYLSLTGDSSDNIPGVPGVGEKTALKIIEKYGSLDHLLANMETVEDKIRKKIEANRELLDISRRLVDLSRGPEGDEETMGTFQPSPFKDEISPGLLEFFRELSFNTLVKRLEGSVSGAGDAQGDAAEETVRTRLDIHYHTVKNTDQLARLKDKILAENYFAFDLETTALEYYNADIVGLSISFRDEGYYIPLVYSLTDAAEISLRFSDFKERLSDVFADPTIRKTGHNLKFDMLHLKGRGIEVGGAWDDSMVMSYLLYPNRRAHNLKELTLEFLNYRQVEYTELTGKGKNQRPLITVDLDTLARYCIDDSHLSLGLADILGEQLKEKGLAELYRDIEMPLVDVLMDMEFAGVCLDTAFLKHAAAAMKEKITAVEEEVFDAAGYRFNLNSSQQLGELLFEKMNLPVKKKTRKTKSYSTDIEVLTELKDHPVVARVIEYRTYKKLLSTYLVGLTNNVDDHGRVHTSFNQTVTATGRLSSSYPNLQNIPVGEVAGINVRDAFTPAKGQRFLAADYSQVELRVMAHFSRDPNLVEAFEKDFDIHQHTADIVFGGDEDISNHEKRKRAKIINFSVLYGSGAFSLSRELGVGFKEAQEFIDRYFEKYPGVKDFIDRTIAAAEESAQVKTISGRTRDIPEILSANRTVKDNGKRMAVNTIIQGSAADIIKVAMINIHRQLKEQGLKARLLMQVHDELVFEYPPEEEARLFAMVKQEMEHALELRVPLKVSMKSGSTWGSLETVAEG